MSIPLMASHLQGSALAPAWLLMVYAISLQSMVVRRVRANDREAAVAWWLGGALVVGTGIWAGSFLCLVALKVPIKIGYVRDVVMASWLPAVVVSAMALWLQTHAMMSLKLRVMGALLVAMGLCMLLFVNASSIMIQPGLTWDGGTLSGAVLVLLLGCGLGSWLMRHDLSREPHQARHLGVAVVVGSIVWAGMALQVDSIGLKLNAVCLSADQLSGDDLQLLLTVAVLILMVMTHMGTIQDARALAKTRALSDSLKEAQEALEEASQRDAVTGLPNRLGFEQQLRSVIDAPRESALHLCVLRMNIDGFHAFAATYGHNLGDKLIHTLSLRLQGMVREGDVLARSDTDEFLLACHGAPDEHAMTVLAQRLQDAIHVPCLSRTKTSWSAAPSASRAIPTAPRPSNSLRTPTTRCSRLAAPAVVSIACTSAAWTAPALRRWRCSVICATPSIARNSSCTSSPSCVPPRVSWPASRPCCAGTTRSGAWSARPSSSRWPSGLA